MSKQRLEAFSDAVIAIILTIMVLELKVPHDPTWAALLPLLPIALSYVLSYIYLGIYWNNHHHMVHTMNHVTGKILWLNLILLFFLSLIPFTTAWMGENHFETAPVALYGVNLLFCGVAYFFLQNSIIASQGENSLLKKAVAGDFKGKVSPIGYLLGIVFSFFSPTVAGLIYTAIALMWLVPDRRIEIALAASGHNSK